MTFLLLYNLCNRLAQQLIDKEVIFAEDVENIFGKRPWASRSEEIMKAKQQSAELKQLEQKEEQLAEEAEKEVREHAEDNEESK